MYSKEDARLLRKEFWSSFSDYTTFFSKTKGEPVKWMLYKTGIKGLELKFDVEKKVIRVVLEVNARSEDRRFNIYVDLDMYKSIIEQGLEEELIWEEEYLLPEGKKVSRIYCEMTGVKYHNRDNWPTIFKFMGDKMYILQSNFLDIRPILEEKYKYI